MPDPWSYAKASEHSHQAALFMWANMAQRFGLEIANDIKAYTVAGYANEMLHAIHSGQGYDPSIPQLKWLHAIHNQGHGDRVRGNIAKAEGVKAGVYDVFLPVPMVHPIGQLKAGFYLEMKVGKGTRSEKQCEFATDMEAVGYATGVAWSWLEARNILLDYLGLPIYQMPT